MDALMKSLLIRCLSVGAISLAALSAHAQTQPGGWPTKPIRFIVPFAPGGGADISARVIATHMTGSLGQSVFVENKPGAGGVIGTDMVAKSPGDGYTILLGTIGPMAINPHLYKKLPYSVDRDFMPISLAGNALNVLVVNPQVPARTVAEFITYAKTNPVAFGSSGNGATDHLAGELFNTLTGTKMTHVAYKGGTPAMLDLMGGHVQAVFSTVSTAAGAIKGGQIRPLAMTGSKRYAAMPELPTIAEAGVPAFVVNNWYGVLAPAGTPPEVVARLNKALVAALQAPEVQAKMNESGIEPAWNTPSVFSTYIHAESDKWKKIVADSGATAD
jgi:tripartite-type tricarboxylate transporter receptor subunit TctC